MSWSALLAFSLIAALIVMSFLQWTGRWRSWYRPTDPTFRAIFATVGPSPLLVPTLLGGVVVMVSLILLSDAIHFHPLVDVGIAAGLAGIVLGGWIAFRQPEWALPDWMQEHPHHARRG